MRKLGVITFGALCILAAALSIVAALEGKIAPTFTMGGSALMMWGFARNISVRRARDRAVGYAALGIGSVSIGTCMALDNRIVGSLFVIICGAFSVYVAVRLRF
ncbi:hypothetical protein ACWEQA_05965 [Nocardia sp. NPDC004085]